MNKVIATSFLPTVMLLIIRVSVLNVFKDISWINRTSVKFYLKIAFLLTIMGYARNVLMITILISIKNALYYLKTV